MSDKDLRNHLIVQRRIDHLLETGINYRLKNRNYLNPSFSEEIVPFRYEEVGAFMYFARIRAIIESKLTEKAVDYREIYYKLPKEEEGHNLERRTKDLLLRDHSVAERNIHDVLLTGNNFNLSLESYVTPHCVSEILPYERPNGRLKHLIRVRKVIEFALACGRVPKALVPYIAPDYLRNLSY